MNYSIEQTTKALGEAVCDTLIEILSGQDIVIQEQHLQNFERFLSISANQKELNQLYEITRSLSSLIEGKKGLLLDKRTYVQILAVAPNFIREIKPESSFLQHFSGTSLISQNKSTTYSKSKKILIATSNWAFWLLLSEVAKQHGFDCKLLKNFEHISESELPGAIIIDFDSVAHQTDKLSVFSSLNNASIIKSHIFFIGDIADYDARLFSVRFGASRFFSKPLDTLRIISALKGVTSPELISPYKVLMVDDDKLMGKVHESALKKTGFDCLLIQNPLEALKAINQFQPDVIVTDLMMNGCNGLELLAMIRQDDALVEIPIIFLTSVSDEETKIETLARGAEFFLTKPVSIAALYKTLLAFAKKSRRLRRFRADLKEMSNRLMKANL